MEAEAAKLIGAGLACVGMAGAGVGLGHIFGQYLSGALRNIRNQIVIFPMKRAWCGVRGGRLPPAQGGVATFGHLCD